jgi:hypothetical protein
LAAALAIPTALAFWLFAAQLAAGWLINIGPRPSVDVIAWSGLIVWPTLT